MMGADAYWQCHDHGEVAINRYLQLRNHSSLHHPNAITAAQHLTIVDPVVPKALPSLDQLIC